MKKYIFITCEGSTFQPNSESPEPDIENLQVIGFEQGDSVNDAFNQLLEKNEYLLNTNFDEIFSIQLANDKREYFSLASVKSQIVYN
jgi:hypothetical protein